MEQLVGVNAEFPVRFQKIDDSVSEELGRSKPNRTRNNSNTTRMYRRMRAESERPKGSSKVGLNEANGIEVAFRPLQPVGLQGKIRQKVPKSH